jgi:hypothetical protein
MAVAKLGYSLQLLIQTHTLTLMVLVKWPESERLVALRVCLVALQLCLVAVKPIKKHYGKLTYKTGSRLAK